MKKVEPNEFSFEEWRRLTPSQKHTLMNEHWNPAQLEKTCEATRRAVLESFARAYPRLLEDGLAGTAYFSVAGWSIVVVVTDRSRRVAKAFDVFPVVKGIAKDKRDPWASVEWLGR